MNKKIILALSLSSLIAIGCAKQQPNQDNSKYGAQELWEIEYGMTQSPVDIVVSDTEIKEDLGMIEPKIDNKATKIYDTGYTIQVNGTGESMINGRKFNFLQAHFHTPGEHTIDGRSYPLELHFVHQAQNGRLAVLGSLFEVGAYNPTLQIILDNVGNSDVSIDLQSLLPQNLSYYHYLGSLTTPPLSENVDWYVLKNSIEASSDQIMQLEELHKRPNNRTTQELNGRKVLTKDKN